MNRPGTGPYAGWCGKTGVSHPFLPDILKLEPTDHPGILENEYFFMNLARKAGLPTAKVKLVRDGKNQVGLLVERFDRIYCSHTKRITSWHQEDACQFLKKYPGDKYRLSIAEIVGGIAELSSSPAVDTLALLRLLAFGYLITNGDLHAKNISLRQDPSTSRVSLTPAYDLLATLPYGDSGMALKFEGFTNNLKARYFFNFGERFDLRYPAIKSMLLKVCTAVSNGVEVITSESFANKIPAPKIKQLVREIKRRLQDLNPE